MEAYYQFGNSADGIKIHLYLNPDDVSELRQYLERFTDTDSISNKLIRTILQEIDENEL